MLRKPIVAALKQPQVGGAAEARLSQVVVGNLRSDSREEEPPWTIHQPAGQRRGADLPSTLEDNADAEPGVAGTAPLPGFGPPLGAWIKRRLRILVIILAVFAIGPIALIAAVSMINRHPPQTDQQKAEQERPFALASAAPAADSASAASRAVGTTVSASNGGNDSVGGNGSPARTVSPFRAPRDL